jgi:hypothetical protein
LRQTRRCLPGAPAPARPRIAGDLFVQSRHQPGRQTSGLLDQH